MVSFLGVRLTKPLGQLAFLLVPVFLGDGDRLAGVQPLEQEDVNPFLDLAFLIGPNQFAYIFADATLLFVKASGGRRWRY